MGKKSGSPPPPPDYAAIAREQAGLQRENIDAQTRANRPNQRNPWGQVNWSQDGQGNWTQETTLDPRLQGALDSQLDVQRGRSQLASSMMGSVSENLSRPFDFSALPAGASRIGGAEDYSTRAGDALFAQARSRLDPMFAEREDAMRSRMANMGFKQGDEGFDRAMGAFGRERNDAYDSAMRSAAQMQGQEASRMQGMDLSAGNFANLLRDRALSEGLQSRRMPLEEMNAVLSSHEVRAPQFQGFQGSGLGQTPDLMGAAQSTYQGQIDAFNARQARSQGLMGGLASLAGAGASVYGAMRGVPFGFGR